MHDRQTLNGLEAAPAGPDHAYEVQREAVVGMLERERRSMPASLLALSLLAVATSFLPDPRMMALLLLARIFSFLLTRSAARALEARLRARAPLAWAQRRVVAAMMLTGVTLGLLLWPQHPAAPSAAVAALFLTAVVTLTLISVTLAALAAGRDAMLASFWLTTTAIVLFHPAQVPPAMVLVVTLLAVGVRMYTSSAGKHIVNSAEVFVENRRLSEDLATALAHAEFLSWRDPLTGLLNRRRLFENREEEAPLPEPRHLLTIDLDHFKAINDSLGHAAGDHVLIAAADAIRELIAELPAGPHRAFRVGGEEFLVILFGLEHACAHAAAEALRARIARSGEHLTQYEGLSVTASLGLAEWRKGEPLDEVLLRSDLACYEAKGHGRDRVCAAA